ncbi:hypothetical protein [Phage blackswan219-1]|nr:hypothetical protein [Phage blackswan219-1]
MRAASRRASSLYQLVDGHGEACRSNRGWLCRVGLSFAGLQKTDQGGSGDIIKDGPGVQVFVTDDGKATVPLNPKFAHVLKLDLIHARAVALLPRMVDGEGYLIPGFACHGVGSVSLFVL